MKADDRSDIAVTASPSPAAPSPASWIEKTPGVCGGNARIRKTRVTVWGLVERRSSGLSDDEILEGLPDLTEADLKAAWDYYEHHRAEIDEAIREAAEA